MPYFRLLTFGQTGRSIRKSMHRSCGRSLSMLRVGMLAVAAQAAAQFVLVEVGSVELSEEWMA